MGGDRGRRRWWWRSPVWGERWRKMAAPAAMTGVALETKNNWAFDADARKPPVVPNPFYQDSLEISHDSLAAGCETDANGNQRR